MNALGLNKLRLNAHRSGHILIAIFLLALILRAIWIAFIPVIPLSDSHAYDIFAQNLARHGVFGWTADQPSAFWPVGTSAAYALLYKIFGISYWPITLFNIVINLGFIYCCFLLAKHFFNEPTGYMTALLLALWPTHIFFSTVLSSELLYMFLTALAAVFWFIPATHRIAYFALSGISLALASYVRPTAMLLPVVFAAGPLLWSGIQIWQKKISIKRPDWQPPLLGGLITLTIMALLIAPWTYRNYKLYNAFVPISTNGGITFWMGNNKSGSLDYAPIPATVAHLNDYEQSKALKKEAVEYIKNDPIAFLIRSVQKIYHLHSHETIGITWNKTGIENILGPDSITPLKILTQGYWLIVLLLSLTGLVILLRRKGLGDLLFHPLTLIWIYYTAIHTIVLAQDRYHFSFVVSLAIFAAYAAQHSLLTSKLLYNYEHQTQYPEE